MFCCCTLDRLCCSGDEGRNGPLSGARTPSRLFDRCEVNDERRRVGVACTDINAFRVSDSRDGRITDWGIIGALEGGTAGLFISSSIFGSLETLEVELAKTSFFRLPVGVALICTPWNRGFLTGFFDSGYC